MLASRMRRTETYVDQRRSMSLPGSNNSAESLSFTGNVGKSTIVECAL